MFFESLSHPAHEEGLQGLHQKCQAGTQERETQDQQNYTGRCVVETCCSDKVSAAVALV